MFDTAVVDRLSIVFIVAEENPPFGDESMCSFGNNIYWFPEVLFPIIEYWCEIIYPSISSMLSKYTLFDLLRNLLN